MSDIQAAAKFHQDGINEASKRIASFKHKKALQIRMRMALSDEQYEFACKLIDAQLKLLSAKG